VSPLGQHLHTLRDKIDDPLLRMSHKDFGQLFALKRGSNVLDAKLML
jgi:hypothetical protein